MKICLYSPYVPKHVGGGEKYFFDVAKTLVGLGHQVFVAVSKDLNEQPTYPLVASSGAETPLPDQAQIRQKYQHFLDYSLAEVQFIAAPLNNAVPFAQKLWWTQHWDVLYYATDGSLFFSLAKKNILHIQVPFTAPKKSLLERLKLWNWSVKNTNSIFTKRVVEKAWVTKVNYVHYPMVESPIVPANLFAQKEKMIVHVGRFFRAMHSKKQEVLVEIFQELLKKYPQEAQGWKLVLIGSIERPDFFEEVKAKAKGWPIELLQVDRQELWRYYQRASIYWHATGFDLDEEHEPEKMEHFGISTVEAMSMGCVPIVIGQGGQPEVVGTALKELLWKTKAECIKITVNMIMNPELRKEKAQQAQIQAQHFNAQQFSTILQKMIDS